MSARMPTASFSDPRQLTAGLAPLTPLAMLGFACAWLRVSGLDLHQPLRNAPGWRWRARPPPLPRHLAADNLDGGGFFPPLNLLFGHLGFLKNGFRFFSHWQRARRFVIDRAFFVEALFQPTNLPAAPCPQLMRKFRVIPKRGFQATKTTSTESVDRPLSRFPSSAQSDSHPRVLVA